MLSDTHPDVERVQIDLLRAAGEAKRFAMMRSLTATVIGLSRRAIARANPTWSEDEVAIKFVELNYGKELAEGVRQRLEKQRR